MSPVVRHSIRAAVLDLERRFSGAGAPADPDPTSEVPAAGAEVPESGQDGFF